MAAFIYAPSTVNANVAGGVEVSLKQETFYPFDETVKVTVNFDSKKVRKAEFPLYFRVPKWCPQAEVKVNGVNVNCVSKAGATVRICRQWERGDVVTFELMLENFKVETREDTGVYPWNLENAPVTIKAKAVVIKPWKEYNGSSCSRFL